MRPRETFVHGGERHSTGFHGDRRRSFGCGVHGGRSGRDAERCLGLRSPHDGSGCRRPFHVVGGLDRHQLEGPEAESRVRRADRQSCRSYLPRRHLRRRWLDSAQAWCPDPRHASPARAMGPPGSLAHGLRVRGADLAGLRRQAVRVLRGGRPARRWHDAASWDTQACGAVPEKACAHSNRRRQGQLAALHEARSLAGRAAARCEPA